MAMSSFPYKLSRCESSTCTDHTEYICGNCQRAFCSKCKVRHLNNLETMDHKIVTNREKYEYNPKQEECVRHYDSVYGMYCTSCELSVCFKCTGHENHKLVDIQKACETKQQQCEGIIDKIRSDVLISRYYLRSKIKDDVKKCQNKFSTYHLEMFKKAQKLKDYVDNTSSGSYCNHRCLRQIRKIIRYIECIQMYEYNIENSTTVKLLLLIKKIKVLQFKSKRQLVYHNNLCMTETLIKKDVIIFLSGVHITEGVIRKVRNETLLKLMPRGPELDKILTNTREANFRHISYLTSDKLWVNDGKRKLSLINKTGAYFFHC